MLLSEVKRLASRGEGLSLEFKKKAAHPEKIIREIIAFANTSGGTLLLGVDDDGTVSGQKFIQDEVYVLEKAIEEEIRPKIEFSREIIEITEKKGIAIFEIPQSPNRPHFLYEEGKRKSYVRVEDRSIQASKEVWEVIKKSRQPRDVVFTYREKEETLMKAIEEHGKITVKEYSRIARIPKFLASRTLVRLTLASVLELHPQESEDFFTLKGED
ncbi:AlbA family DNA-binding domain-containing protein [Algoriphagus sediminis]|uniref:ATP-binding protein n=1 Tax=Algoriphagus sediminis TaxID=3057113 RepID=A0ABT7YED7_9BACT|nr:ATP-binding protein [Algoriphagus sediminis]MDN3204836.1 ATP-binding protein [Algoriphagus sediminis]